MIGVFCEFDGARVLGRAREVADSLGQRVLAISSHREDPELATKLIHQGADELVMCHGATAVFDWSKILSELIKDERRGIDLLLGTSGLLTDAIFGRVYATLKGKVSGFATGVESLGDSYDASKSILAWMVRMHFKSTQGEESKTAIFSLKESSLPEPFEDQSRYGKKSEFHPEHQDLKQKSSPAVSGVKREGFLDSSAFISILIRSDWSSNSTNLRETSDLVEGLSKKYKATIVHENQKEIYGNCFAIDKEREFGKKIPIFHGELIALVTSEHDTLAKVAGTAFITEDVSGVLRQLSQG